MTTTVIIPSRFNGPPQSGNGGYTCGLLASYIDGAATVRLHAPPPLEKPMQLRQLQSGLVDLHDEDTLIGTANAAPWQLDIPAAPSLEDARRGQQAFCAYDNHFFPHCFVCGPARAVEDGLCLHPGPVDDWNLLACAWQPAANLLDGDGMLTPEIIWSALDCPGYFAAAGKEQPPSLLGELTGTIFAKVAGAEELIVFSWPLGPAEGRKRRGATAIANQQGEVLAASQSLWIEVKTRAS
ncbi:hypothetical protein EYC98_11835 [Halieaceae bacterium IMCC14734]|uniref:Thioesterase family protein n=1 Tax=Candidatus Litorirhabdus singularis TaxID=2518993 RepID=A0ABT3TGV3_9GAMM|nr:hypothetical protein [Candidatus Litorirhabdus singularis]MCX2981552.1 hypothetical protein [Candidatus Litorirhabdus singularis]